MGVRARALQLRAATLLQLMAAPAGGIQARLVKLQLQRTAAQVDRVDQVDKVDKVDKAAPAPANKPQLEAQEVSLGLRALAARSPLHPTAYLPLHAIAALHTGRQSKLEPSSQLSSPRCLGSR